MMEDPSFKSPLTVRYCINKINQNKFLLLSIQRDFVWKPRQVIELFDSLLQGYPINSFLFWQVDGHNIRDFQYYKFIKDYNEHERTHNEGTTPLQDDDFIVVLDGQQRLTALYMGLVGSYAYKVKYRRYDDTKSYPERRLYLNLLYSPEESETDQKFDLKFLTNEEVDRTKDGEKWFKVGDVLDFKGPEDIDSWLEKNGLVQNKHSRYYLEKLYNVINKEEVIYYYLDTSKDMDRVLKIFVRLNSAGTTLSHSDLLLSIVIAQWENRDVRREITNFVDELNKIGGRFSFNKDFVLKAALVLSDINDIAFKVDNFTIDNIKTIERNWVQIKEAIRISVNLVSKFGYNGQTLSSANALIPIAYFILKKNNPPNFLDSSYYTKERENIKKWLVRALLKQQFSGAPDNVLRKTREIIKSHEDGFPLDDLIKKFEGSNKSLDLTSENIDNLLNYEYGNKHLFTIMSLIYFDFNYSDRTFHIDHIFPKKFFTENKMKELGVSEEDRAKFYLNMNVVGNLQLLPGTQNEEKSAKDFLEWLYSTYPNKERRNRFLDDHLIPNDDNDLQFRNFLAFLKNRNQMIKERLKQTLNIT